MIETEKKQERILLVGVELQGMDNFDMSMEELASLAKTAGGDVRGSYTQKREKYDTKTFVGSGKLEEIAQMVEADEITTVVVNNRLTPRQNVNLEEILGVTRNSSLTLRESRALKKPVRSSSAIRGVLLNGN